METRSPSGQGRTDSVETRAAPAPHIQAGGNISNVFVADHHYGKRVAAAATRQPRQPPCMTEYRERGSPPGGKQQTFYPQHVQKTALVIEDIREACIELRQRGYIYIYVIA